MKILFRKFLLITALIALATVAASADQKIKVKAEAGHNKNAGLELNQKTGDLLVYWEKDGAIYTAVLKPKKNNPQKFKLGKAIKITPDGGSYNRPNAIYNPATGGYLLVCDTWAGDLDTLGGPPGNQKISRSRGPSAQGNRSDITLINIKANGKRKGKLIRAAKGEQVLLISSIEAINSNSLSDSPDDAAFRIYFTAMPTGFDGVSQAAPPAGRTPGIWIVDCTSAGKCSKPRLFFDATFSSSSPVLFTPKDEDLDSGVSIWKCFRIFEANHRVIFGNFEPGSPQSFSNSGQINIGRPEGDYPVYLFKDKFGDNIITDVHRLPDETYLVSLKVKDKDTGDWHIWHAHREIRFDCSGNLVVQYLKIYRPGYPYETILESLKQNKSEGSKAPSAATDGVYLWAALALSNGNASLAKYDQNAVKIGQRKFLFNHNFRIEEIKLAIAPLAGKCVVLWVENKAGTVSRTASEKTTELNLQITTAN